MQLKDIVQPECVKVPLDAQEKYQAIKELIDLLDQAGLLKNHQESLDAVLQRESVRSTGVGQGFAIPHGKCPSVDRMIMAIGKTAIPIDFESIDNQPVNIIILLISPLGQTGPHIQALAKISRLMTDTASRKSILMSENAAQLFQNFANT